MVCNWTEKETTSKLFEDVPDSVDFVSLWEQSYLSDEQKQFEILPEVKEKALYVGLFKIWEITDS